MSDTPHIKRFKEYELDEEALRRGIPQPSRTVTMLDDLAEHIERLESWFRTHKHFFYQPIEGITEEPYCPHGNFQDSCFDCATDTAPETKES